MNQSDSRSNLSTSYLNATGKIDYGMTNDYMFRVILQRRRNVLKGLICSLLHLHPKDIKDIVIRNPLHLGEAIDDKAFILDIEVLLNNNSLINLEMQVVNELNWTDRAIAYLCRLFDQLYRGQEYKEALPVIHIGFLDFCLFPNHKEFFGIYKLFNEKDHYLFSDKLALGVVDLTHIELATEEDKTYGIDHWARLFKATTWEEIKMIAENDEFMSEATQALYEYNADQIIRQKCEAREEHERYHRTLHKVISDAQTRLLEQEATIQANEAAIQKQETALQKQEAALQKQEAALQKQEAALQEQAAALAEKDASLAAKDAEIARLLALLEEKK